MARPRGVFGWQQSAAALRSVGKIATVPANEAARYALAPAVKAAKDNLRSNGSVKFGALLASLTLKRNYKAPKGRVSMLVGPSAKYVGKNGQKPVRYAHLVEFGTAPHDEPKAGIRHPGARPKPFLRAAFESTKDAVVKRFTERFAVALEKRAAKLAAKKVTL